MKTRHPTHKKQTRSGAASCCQRSSALGHSEPDDQFLNEGFQFTIPVSGMTCGSCARRVEKGLAAVVGVETVRVDMVAACAKVRVGIGHHVVHQTLVDAVIQSGYGTQKATAATRNNIQGRSQVGFSLIAYGVLTVLAAIGFYLGLITLTSDWENALAEFASYYGYIVTLAVGLGLQVSLFIHLRRRMAGMHLRGTASSVAASGGMSATAMAVCCSHYLATLLPVIGLPFLSGTVAGLTAYQEIFFVLGILSNLAGLAYMVHTMSRHGVLKINLLHSVTV